MKKTTTIKLENLISFNNKIFYNRVNWETEVEV